MFKSLKGKVYVMKYENEYEYTIKTWPTINGVLIDNQRTIELIDIRTEEGMLKIVEIHNDLFYTNKNGVEKQAAVLALEKPKKEKIAGLRSADDRIFVYFEDEKDEDIILNVGKVYRSLDESAAKVKVLEKQK